MTLRSPELIFKYDRDSSGLVKKYYVKINLILKNTKQFIEIHFFEWFSVLLFIEIRNQHDCTNIKVVIKNPNYFTTPIGKRILMLSICL